VSAKPLPLASGEPDLEDIARPRTRGDCIAGPRPCPWAGCRHSLVLLNVSEKSGRIKERDEADLDALTETCALDVADDGGLGVQEVGALFRMTHQNVAVTVQRAVVKLRPLLSRDLLDGWSNTSETSHEETLFEIVDADFKAAVERAYVRIVPESERGSNAIRATKRGPS